MKLLTLLCALTILPIHATKNKKQTSAKQQQEQPRMIRHYGRNCEMLIKTLPFKYQSQAPERNREKQIEDDSQTKKTSSNT